MAFELNRFIDMCLEGVSDANPLERVRQLLQAAVDDPSISTALPKAKEDETLLHESAELTVYSLRLTPCILYPPHDHRMTAVIGLYEGFETNYFFRRDGRRLVSTGVSESCAPEVVVLPPDAIHSVANPGQSYSRAIHVYLGPLTKIARSVWAADGMRERPFDNSFYFEQARPLPN
jgi:predicted metal-dependent enzyme (double-stranded beta helix superfamily)